jgi:predicted RNase H-like HicB family nuclease
MDMENKLNLTAVFLPAEEGGFTAYIEEIRGVISEGDTIEEAQENLYDALELILETQRSEREKELSGKNVVRKTLRIAV